MFLPIKQPFQYAVGTPREVGVNLKNGYNGDLSSREAGSVGGQMVKDMRPVRTIQIPRINRTSEGHCMMLTYITRITA